MGKSIAFYAPLKSPTHPTPSGDRTIARGLLSALRDIDWVDRVQLVSKLRSRDGAGDVAVQRDLMRAAEIEVKKLLGQRGGWDAWVTYHNYYKAPDLIGPAVCAEMGIPYFVIEASRSPNRADGPWSAFAAQADAASDAANAIFYFTKRDLPELSKARCDGQALVHLRPFLDRVELPDPCIEENDKKLLAIGMLRPGDKLASYGNLAAALDLIKSRYWMLDIVGDGAAEDQVKDLFLPFGPRVTFWGELPERWVQQRIMESRALVWPGVNEAFGMVYLEAQAVGLPIVAEDRPGVRDVVGPASWLTPPDDPVAFSEAVEQMFDEPWDIAASRNFIQDRHLRGGASRTLIETIGSFL